MKARKTDIRLLYVPKISVMDSNELSFTLKQLKKEQAERTKVETER